MERNLIDVETDAITDLAARARVVRRKVIVPVAIVALVLGHLGIAAHALGYWSVGGVLDDGTYYVNKFTLMAAFGLPSAPIVVLGAIVYAVMRMATRSAWREEFASRGLEASWLDANVTRFP